MKCTVQVNALQSESALVMDRDATVVAVALIGNLGSNSGSGSADRELRIQQW